MARGFYSTDGSSTTDALDTGASVYSTQMSYAFWIWRTGAGGGDLARVFDKDGATTGGRYFYYSGSGAVFGWGIIWTGGGGGNWTFPENTSGQWASFVLTYDGSSPSNTPAAYVNGVSQTMTLTSGAPSGSLDTSGVGPYIIGNRADGVRGWNGRLAEFAHWDRVLTADEIAALAKGASPAFFPSGSVFYYPLLGRYSPEADRSIGVNYPGTLTGTAYQDHPRIIYPSQMQQFGSPRQPAQTVITISAPTATLATAGANETLTAGQNTVTVSAPAQSQSAETTVAAGQNTITSSAPTVPAVHLTVPQTVNTITVSAPAQSELHAVTLAGGENLITASAPTAVLDLSSPGVNLSAGQNTVTISAPAQSQATEVTVAAGQNTLTVSAPAQSELHALTLAAGQNTITVSAPAQTELHAVTLAAGQNTITVSAPAQTELHALMLAAGQNTCVVSAPVAELLTSGALAAGQSIITVSAPDVPAVHLTIPQTTNTITVSAPAQSESHAVVVTAGQIIVTVSVPVADLVAAGGGSVLAAGENVITVSAATIPAVHLTAPQAFNTIVVTAPAQTQLLESFLAATACIIDVSAPTAGVSADSTLVAGVNIVAAVAPDVLMHLELLSGVNEILLTAPTAGIALTFDSLLVACTPTVTVYNPIVTVQPQYFGDVVRQANAKVRLTQHATAATGSWLRGDEARTTRLVSTTTKRVTE